MRFNQKQKTAMEATNDKKTNLQNCIEKLKALKAYDKFIANLKRLRSMDTVEDYIDTDEDYLCKSFKVYISCAFVWEETQEGQKFWSKIAES